LAGFCNHPLAPHPGKDRSPLFKDGGEFLQVFFEVSHDAKDKEERQNDEEKGRIQ
jgi:hypothetical protein